MEQRTAEQYYLFWLLIQLEQMISLHLYVNTLKTLVYLNSFMENKIIISLLCTKTQGTEKLKAPF